MGCEAIDVNSALLALRGQWAKLARFRGGDKLFTPRGMVGEASGPSGVCDELA
jgi:hypothetical protein